MLEKDIETTTPPNKPDAKELVSDPSTIDNKSWKLIEKLVLAQSRQSRWSGLGRWLFRSAVLTFIIMMAFGIPQRYHPGFDSSVINDPHIAKIKISGVIAENSNANARSINESLTKAFKNDQAKAVVLDISSPGGSPVQSDLIWKKITELKTKHDKKVYAVIGDIGASGAYYIAAAADRIYSNDNSLVGSIGVINSGFGFNNLIDDLGIERRVITSGINKSFNDPFKPQSKEHADHLTNIVQKIHKRFKFVVVSGRKDAIDKDQYEKIFSGLAWVGSEALELGLIDGIKSIDDVILEVDESLKIKDYSQKQSPFDQLTSKFGQVLSQTLLQPGQNNTMLQHPL